MLWELLCVELLCVLLCTDSMASAHHSQNCKGAQDSGDYKAKRCPLAVLIGTYLSLSEEKKSTYVQRAQWGEKRGECTMGFFLRWKNTKSWSTGTKQMKIFNVSSLECELCAILCIQSHVITKILSGSFHCRNQRSYFEHYSCKQALISVTKKHSEILAQLF